MDAEIITEVFKISNLVLSDYCTTASFLLSGESTLQRVKAYKLTPRAFFIHWEKFCESRHTYITSSTSAIALGGTHYVNL